MITRALSFLGGPVNGRSLAKTQRRDTIRDRVSE
jgi:hypothetical protein